MLNTCSLTILNIQKEDDGVYEMQIQIETDVIKSSAKLTVLSGIVAIAVPDVVVTMYGIFYRSYYITYLNYA
jgi:hypothetical protein